jgi:glycosyltransferase involved in cell wall biosynthesis
VADFRDEWRWNPGLGGQPEAVEWLTSKVEGAISAAASRVVVAADYFRLEGLEPDDPRRRVILNGVDESDLPNLADAPSQDRFVLAHVGTVYEAVDPSPVLRSLARLVQRGELDPARIEVRLAGNIWLEGFHPPPIVSVRHTGYLEHARAVEEMCSATALLLFVPTSSLAPSGKLFEYLASGRPLLCVAHPDNLASRLVREWDGGVTANPDDDSQIEAAILTLWRRWQQNGLPDQAEVRRRTLERYSRQAGAAQLAGVLDEAVRTRDD